MIDVTVDGGKYRVLMPEKGGLHALRHGEPWRDLAGDNLVYFLAAELQAAREACGLMREALAKYGAQVGDLFGHDEQFIAAVDAVLTAAGDTD